MHGADNRFSILVVNGTTENIQIVANILREQRYRMAFARNSIEKSSLCGTIIKLTISEEFCSNSVIIRSVVVSCHGYF